jgi:hypothetical protein
LSFLGDYAMPALPKTKKLPAVPKKIHLAFSGEEKSILY